MAEEPALYRDPNKETKRRIKQLISEIALSGHEALEYYVYSDDDLSVNWEVVVKRIRRPEVPF